MLRGNIWPVDPKAKVGSAVGCLPSYNRHMHDDCDRVSYAYSAAGLLGTEVRPKDPLLMAIDEIDCIRVCQTRALACSQPDQMINVP